MSTLVGCSTDDREFAGCSSAMSDATDPDSFTEAATTREPAHSRICPSRKIGSSDRSLEMLRVLNAWFDVAERASHRGPDRSDSLPEFNDRTPPTP